MTDVFAKLILVVGNKKEEYLLNRSIPQKVIDKRVSDILAVIPHDDWYIIE